MIKVYFVHTLSTCCHRNQVIRTDEEDHISQGYFHIMIPLLQDLFFFCSIFFKSNQFHTLRQIDVTTFGVLLIYRCDHHTVTQ